MNGLVFFLAVTAVICALVGYGYFQDWEYGSGWFCITCSVAIGFCAYLSWSTPEELKAKEAAAAAERTAEITPRKVSSADGCTVYAFKPGDRWLYFTKCTNAETTTTNEWTVRSGKTTRNESMQIKATP